jgi:hypothetical protein
MSWMYDAIKAGVQEALRGLYIGMPGRLEAYDHKTGKGQVKPLIQEPDQKGVLRSLKPISGVPVVMPGGSSASLYLPPAVGDTGWISFSHRSIENWLDKGGDASPGDPRIMDMSDAVFWPGLRPFSEGSLGEEEGAAIFKNGLAKIKIKDGKIAIGSETAELLDLLSQQLDLLLTGIVPTMLGPQQLSTVTSGQMLQIKTLLTSIKGSI